MRQLVIAIKDVKSGVFTPPMVFVSAGVAMRSFGDVVNDEKSEISKHPGDYGMYQLGVFDDVSGVFENAEHPILLIDGDMVRAQNAEQLSLVSGGRR